VSHYPGHRGTSKRKQEEIFNSPGSLGQGLGVGGGGGGVLPKLAQTTCSVETAMVASMMFVGEI